MQSPVKLNCGFCTLLSRAHPPGTIKISGLGQKAGVCRLIKSAEAGNFYSEKCELEIWFELFWQLLGQAMPKKRLTQAQKVQRANALGKRGKKQKTADPVPEVASVFAKSVSAKTKASLLRKQHATLPASMASPAGRKTGQDATKRKQRGALSPQKDQGVTPQRSTKLPSRLSYSANHKPQ